MEFGGGGGKGIQLPHITYCKNQILLVIVTHCNDFTDDFWRFYFLIGTFARETADPRERFLIKSIGVVFLLVFFSLIYFTQ